MGDAGKSLVKESVSRSTYVRLPLGAREDFKGRLGNLRASHFALGDSTFQGVPEYKAAYVKQGLIPNPMDAARAKDIRDSHISYLFSPKRADWGKSTYQDKIGDLSGKPLPLERPNIDLHKSHFLLGEEEPVFNTEMRANYVDHGLPDPPVRAFARRPNAENLLGTLQGKGEYTTETKAQYTGPAPDLNALGLAKEFARGLRKENFALGNAVDDRASHYKVHFNQQVKTGKPARLSVYQLNDVKRSHFDFGSKGEIGITHYTDQHRWLQPILAVPEELK